MNLERGVPRRVFLKWGVVTGVGLVANFFEDRLGIGDVPIKAQQDHKILLPLVSKERPLDDLVRLVDEHSLYTMRTNPYFPRSEWESLLQSHNKRKVTFHWVDSVDKVPYDPHEGRAGEMDAETGIMINWMMEFCSEAPPQEIEFWICTNEEYYKRYGDRKMEVLSRVLSYKLWQAIVAPSRDYLFGRIPSPQPTPEEIERYFRSNTLILASIKTP